MAKQSGARGLQVDQDLSYQRREWLFERVGWGVMLVTVALALLGGFGRGVLSDGTVGDGTGQIELRYQRFLRHHSPTSLTVHLGARAASGGEARVWLGDEFLERVELTQVAPEPLRVEAEPGRHVFVFRADGPAVILFRFEAEQAGPLSGEAGLAGGPPVHFRQFVYP